MMDAFRTDQEIRELAHAPGFALDYDHFQTGVMIEMCMCGCDNQILIRMLKIRQLLGQKPRMMIVDERDRTDNGSARGLDSCNDEAVPD